MVVAQRGASRRGASAGGTVGRRAARASARCRPRRAKWTGGASRSRCASLKWRPALTSTAKSQLATWVDLARSDINIWCLSRVRRSSHGTPLELEGLPQALPRLRVDRDLSGDVVLRKGPLQHAQPRDRQSPEAQDGGCGHRGGSSHRGADQRLRRRQRHVRPGRGRRALQHRHREHAHSRHREVRAEGFDRRSLPRHAVLPRARGQGRAGSVRRHPRCHEKEEDGRYRARGDGAARARDDARAVRQGHHGNDACTIRTRSAATRRCSRKSPR